MTGWVEKNRSQWKAVVRKPSGGRVSKTFARKADANRWKIEQLAAMSKGAFVDPAPARRLTYAEWSAKYRAGEVHLRRTTIERDRSTLECHILPRFGAVRLDAIEQSDVQAWVAELSSGHLAPASVAKIYQVLSKSMSAAVDAGILSTSPCRGIRLPRIERAEMRCLTPTELATLAGECGRHRTMVLVAGYSGLRIGELLALRVGRCAGGVLSVRETVAEVKGELVFGPPKTKASVRRVPLPPPVAELLEEHIAGAPPEALAFRGRQGAPIRARAFRSRIFAGAVRRAEVEPFRLHDLRHTAASVWIQAGVGPKEVAVRLGHTSVRTALDIYGHLWPSQEAEFADAVGRLVEL